MNNTPTPAVTADDIAIWALVIVTALGSLAIQLYDLFKDSAP